MLRSALLVILILSVTASAAAAELLNVSFDVSGDYFRDINTAFNAKQAAEGRPPVTFKQSHGPSGKQARSVIEGLEADVVTLALALDIDAIADKAKLIRPEWRTRLPNGASPYFSTIVFVVRAGNPKGIHDWSDLIKPGVSVITPNPKTGGNPRWAFLAAWGQVLQRGGNADQAKDFVTQLYTHVPVLDPGSVKALGTFARNGIGDVLITWEIDALKLTRDPSFAGPDVQSRFELVVPSISIRAEPVVAVVDKNVDRHGTRALAEEYLSFLYSKPAQELAAKHFFRPRLDAVAARHADFPKLELFDIDPVFGGWKKAQAAFFDDGGVFDQIYKP